jgi:hypothetical protein
MEQSCKGIRIWHEGKLELGLFGFESCGAVVLMRSIHLRRKKQLRHWREEGDAPALAEFGGKKRSRTRRRRNWPQAHLL